MAQIHPTAMIDPTAEIADDVEIGPYTIVEAHVRVGPGCRIGAHATLAARLILGRAVRVYNYACLGTPSQDLKHHGELAWAEVGDETIIREFVTVNAGTREGGVTRIGPRAVLMAYSHVAHECVLEERAILVNAATLGGEVHIGRGAIIGGLVGVHQFCRIGELTIVGAGSKVAQDIGPFLLADGHPARPYGPNLVGLRRAGFGEPQVREIRRIYRELFDRDRTLAENFARIEERFPDSGFATRILEFCQAGSRGLARPRSRRVVTADWPEFNLPEQN